MQLIDQLIDQLINQIINQLNEVILIMARKGNSKARDKEHVEC